MSMPSEDTIRDAARLIVAQMTGSLPKDDELLISSGRIDSLSILNLISSLEKQLTIKLPPASLQPEDFDCIDYIVETVERVGRAE